MTSFMFKHGLVSIKKKMVFSSLEYTLQHHWKNIFVITCITILLFKVKILEKVVTVFKNIINLSFNEELMSLLRIL